MASSTTTMGDLCKKAPTGQKEQDFFDRLIAILDDNYPQNWKSWEVTDISYNDLFGESISPKLEAKLRFAIPTADLAKAYTPHDPTLSEKKYRNIKRKLLQWSLGRAVLYSPHNIMEKIHNESCDVFMNTVKILKPKLTSRDSASSCMPRKRYSESPGLSSSCKKRRRESSPNLQLSSFGKITDLLNSQSQSIDRIEAQVSNLASKADHKEEESGSERSYGTKDIDHSKEEFHAPPEHASLPVELPDADTESEAASDCDFSEEFHAPSVRNKL